MIDKVIVKFYEVGEMILLGDMNARTGVLNDFICNDQPIPIDWESDYIPDIDLKPRNNMDAGINEYSKSLINMCQSFKLRILNSRILGDLLGQFTSYHYNGNSMVDYALISDKLILMYHILKSLSRNVLRSLFN